MKILGAHIIRPAFSGGQSGARSYHPAPDLATLNQTIYIRQIHLRVHTGYFPPGIPVSGFLCVQKDDPAGTGNAKGPYWDGIGVVHVHLGGGGKLESHIDFGANYLELAPTEMLLEEWSLAGTCSQAVWNPSTLAYNTGVLDLHGVGVQPIVDIYWTLTP